MSTDIDLPIEPSSAAVTVAEPTAQKRKASSSPAPPEYAVSKSPKRTRLDDTNGDDTGKANGSARSSPPPPPARRESPKGQLASRRKETSQEEERKRGKRLFGGLLSTLSQTTSSSQQRKRQEIERRQQAKATQKRAEDDHQREEKLSRLKAVRKAEQIRFDERVMHTRHSHLLETARFLQTSTEPKIFYLPWESTADQQDTIKDQIRDAESLIAEEVREFKQRKEKRLQDLGIPVKPSERTTEPEQTVGKTDAETLPNPPPTESTNPPSTHTNKVGQDKETDEAGDVVVEDEDAVLY